ncbi:MAG: cysteine-rich CWC family protein [Myxococcales bacterium]|nr:cysteine-rich CWC family protein [Myxococcales bacterium]
MSSDPRRCALCGGENDCEVARGEASCWCFAVTIPRSLLAKIPEDQRDTACICRACVDAAEPTLRIVES